MFRSWIGIFLCCWVWASSATTTGSYPWDKGSNKMFVNFNNKTVKEILNDFCRVNNCRLEIDTTNNNYLNKPVNGNFNFNNNTELLTFLSDRYGFSWFFYHGRLYIASNSYILEVLSVPPEYLANLKDNLVALGLFSPKFGWAVNQENSTIVVSGPAAYIRLVKNFTQNFSPLPRGNNFIIIKLRYANAADSTINLNGTSYFIPGISTIINNLTNPYIMQEYQGTFQQTNQSTVLLRNMIDGVKGDPTVKNILSTGSDQANKNVENQQIMSTFPIVQSDVRNNSVVIFDKNANLPMYEKLVRYLDVAQKMVQVNTTIIDLDEDKLETKGVNWLANLSGVQVGFNGNQVAPTNSSLSVNSAPGQTLVSSGSLSGLIANINYLTQEGSAKIQSTPSVITLLEMPALLTFNTQINFVGVGTSVNTANNSGGAAGNGSPSQVNAASSIIITPHAVEDGKYRLEIMLQSQQLFDQDNTSSFPILNGGTIQTQAVVAPGGGLILGGYDQEKKVKFTSQVPGLGSIPLLGWFFKSEVEKTVHIKRAYLITISLVDTKD